jgi:hypothetical protein
MPVRRTLEKIGTRTPPSIAGKIWARSADRRPSTTDVPGQIAFLSASSNWRWTSLRYRRGNWAVRFTVTESYFVSEASVYRLLKAHDLIASQPSS